MLSGPWKLLLLSDEGWEKSADKLMYLCISHLIIPGYPPSCGFCLRFFFFFKRVKGGTQCTWHWWGWKKFLFRNLIQKPTSSFSNPNLILTHWPDWCFCTGFGRCSQTMYLEAVIPGVQTGALGARLVLREAGAEKCLGNDAFACRYNAFCRDWSHCASFLSTPHVPVSVQPCRPSSTPPDLVIIVLPVYLLRVFFPDSLSS